MKKSLLLVTIITMLSSTSLFAKAKPYALTNADGHINGFVCQDKEGGGPYHQPCSACGLTPRPGSNYQCISSYVQKAGKQALPGKR